CFRVALLLLVFHALATSKIHTLSLHDALPIYAITKMLDLLHPMYRPTAAYGHFGRDPFDMTYEWEEIENGKKVKKSESFTAFTWERTDKADALRSAAGL